MVQSNPCISQEKKQLLISKIKKIVTDSYSRVAAQEAEICAFGLAADSDISGFYDQFNTAAGIEKIKANRKDLVEEFPELKTYPLDWDKWSIYEWFSEGMDRDVAYHGSPEYEEVEALMAQLSGANDYEVDDNGDLPEEAQEKFENYKVEMFDIFCEVLKQMKDEQVFKNASDDFFLMFQEGDNGVYEASHEQSLAKILSPSQLKEYLKYDASR